MKRILIFSAPFYPRKSGVGNFVLQFSKRMSQKGYEITIFCYDTEKTNRFLEYMRGIRIIRTKNSQLGGYFLPDKAHLKNNLSLLKEKFNLVITNTRFFHTSLVGRKFAKENKIPWIHIEHGSTFVKSNNILIWVGSRIFDLFIGKKILKDADKVVSISEGSKRFVQSLVNRDVEVIPNGVELSNIPKYTIKKEIKNIIFVGRLIYAKGVQDLIYAFSKINNKKLKLTIVGNGPYKKDLEKLVKKLKLQNKIKLTGEKNKREVLNLLSKSDLFVNPSYSEGLPTSVLEAGAVGLPVIATDVGGTREVIINNKTGLLIKEKKPSELRDAIDFMIRNPKQKIIYSRSLNKLIKNKFDWRKIIEEWEKQIRLINI